MTRGKPLVENAILPVVPAGLPSSLLARRPDIQSVEQQLIAANARIGVAKAAYFPEITLTATGGYQSSALTNLFSGPAGFWSLGGQLLQPIFTGGRIRSDVRLTEAQQRRLSFSTPVHSTSLPRGLGLTGRLPQNQESAPSGNWSRSRADAARLSGVAPAASHESPSPRQRHACHDAQLGLAPELNEQLALVQLYNALGVGGSNKNARPPCWKA